MQDSDRDFDISWSEKDMSIGSSLDVQQIALYGKKILKVYTIIHFNLLGIQS